MKKQLISGVVAAAATLYALCCICSLDAGTVSLLGAVLRCGVSGVVIYGAMGGI